MEHIARERRLGILLPVEFESAGKPVTGVAGNISRHGVYVRTEAGIAKDDVVELGIVLPSGLTVRVPGRAVHSIEKGTAQSLGRCAGIGFRFIDDQSPALRAIADLIADVAGEVSLPVGDVAERLRLVVASGDGRLLHRMTTVLGENGYAIEAAASSFEAYVLCMEHRPDLVVVGEYMPSLNGATLPVQLEHGKVEFKVLRLQKPFTDEDLCAQVAVALSREVRRSSLRANLREIPLAALLSFFASACKTGVVTVSRGEQLVELHLRDGQVVSILHVGAAEARACLLNLLDWTEGTLQFYVCPILDPDQIRLPTEVLLLEHARVRDEGARAIPA